ncbi:TPA: hypothetical protein MH533_16060 [Klebsiella pneumoniae]|nr:hypothetical protein [Klebsiella pneumoniae]
MERKKLTCVSYQNKKAKDFFVPCRPYSDRTAPVRSVQAALHWPARITPGLIMFTCALNLFEGERNAKSYSISSQISSGS